MPGYFGRRLMGTMLLASRARWSVHTRPQRESVSLIALPAPRDREGGNRAEEDDMTEIYARQGDVVIRQQPATGELTPAIGLVVAGASSHPHTIVGPCLHRREGRRTVVRLAVPTTIEHAGRHTPISLPAGDYELTPLRERGDDGDRAVED